MAQNTNPLIKGRLLSVVLAMVFYLLSGTALPAQMQAPNYQLTYLEGQEKGPIEGSIENIFRDTLGYIWTITSFGKLMRYDGLRFEYIQASYGTVENVFSGINPFPKTAIDQDGKIWFSYCDRGVFRFNPYDYSINYYHDFVPDDGEKKEETISGIVCDQNGTIWVSTTKSISKYSYAADSFSLVYTGQQSDRLTLTCKGGNRYVVFLEKRANELNLKKLDCETGKVTPFHSMSFYKNISTLWIWNGAGNYVWEAPATVGIVKYYLDDTTYKVLCPVDNKYGIDVKNVHLIWEEDDGTVWVGERGVGIHIFPANQDTVLKVAFENIEQHEISFSTIIPGENGTYWIAMQAGLWKVKKESNPFYKIYYKEQFNPPGDRDYYYDKPLIQIDNNTLLLGTTNGPYLFDTHTKTYIQASTRFPALAYLNNANTGYFFKDSKERIWIWLNQIRKSDLSSWFCYELANDKLTPIDQFPGYTDIDWISLRQSYQVFEDEKGNLYFSDYTSPFLVKLESGTDSLSYFDYGGKHINGYFSFYEKDRKSLWVITNRMGLFLYNWAEHTSSRFYFDPVNSPTSPDMNNGIILKSRKGGFIYKTFNELLEYDYKNQRFSKKISGMNDFSSDFVEDRTGTFWLNSEKGILKIDSTLNKYIYFNEKSGLIHNSLPNGSLLQDQYDWIYASDLDGIIYFHPDSVKTNTQIPPVYISNLKLFNHNVLPGDSTGILTQSIAITPSITLQYQQNVLTLEYIALNYQDSDQNEYAYMLEGFDEQWQYVGSKREVSYTNLSPGTYTFRVKGSNNHGVWNEQGASLEITVLPPWYRTSLAYLCYVLFVAGSIFFLYKFQLNRQLEKQESIRLRELNEFKSQLYTGITHEFRTPLTVILGMAEQAVGFFEKRDAQRFQNAIKLVERNSHQLLHLVNQMLDLASLDAGKIQPDWEQGNIVGFIRYIVESFNSYADSRGVSLSQNHAQTELIMDFDSDKLQKILSNLLTNAIKFTPKGGSVELKSSCTSSHFILQVNDTGTGIAQDDLPLIFDRFFRSENNENYSEGTGIGLALTKELTVLLGGAIHVESTPGKGTNFSVSLPIHNTAPIVSKVQDARTHFPVQTASISKGKEGAPMLLIVEDNEEVAAYLASCLEDQYQLLYARNGQEGIDLALEHIPDFIISDVMMPKKSGFEVCHTLKSDERTSHIPIVLLTAKADESSRHDGLQQGADAYLTKPFNSKELQIRIEQMIALRKRLQIKYQHRAQNLTDLPEDVANENNPQEEAFLQKLRLEVEQLLNHPNLDVSLLCRSMGMSRTQLHRKLSAVAAMSTTQFIRNVRYQKAKQLLRETDLSIAEIAYDVGFSDPAYFTRMFKKELGLTPTEFREK
ncbi:MAG: hybrid sensor histidine kinase/response regulator transcription factor [Saprospiraceae bacterium]